VSVDWSRGGRAGYGGPALPGLQDPGDGTPLRRLGPGYRPALDRPGSSANPS